MSVPPLAPAVAAPPETATPREPRALDRAVAELHDVPQGVWWRSYWVTVLWTTGVLVLTAGGVAFWRDVSGHHVSRLTAYTVGTLGEVSFLVVALVAARRIRQRAGSWQRALGVSRLTRRDVVSGLLWVLVQLLARVVLLAIVGSIVPRSVVKASDNLRATHYHGLLSLALALIAGMLIAPVVEETVSRGLWLRAGMSRWSFARAALVSSAIFGLLHSYEAGSVGGAVLLVLNIALFGLLQCALVRRTGRLGPAMVTHGALNGIALCLALTA